MLSEVKQKIFEGKFGLKEKIYDMHKKSVCIISLNVNLSSNFCGDQVLEDSTSCISSG